tara:strand:- start:78 stop:518 length:441 start_codon:yes stop_codon:yes gene_type:complete
MAQGNWLINSNRSEVRRFIKNTNNKDRFFEYMFVDTAKIAGLTPHALRQWRKHPQADSFISEAINTSLEEAHGTLSKATPLLAEKLISIALDPKVRGYTAVQAISESFKIIQSGVVDRENKIEMKKLREAMERLSGDRIQDDFIDV